MLFSKKAKLLYLFVCISSLTPACSEDSDDTPINKDILIGGIAPLSGDAALYGRMDKLVTDLIFEEINANGGINGRQVDVIWHDTKCDPALAKTKAQELIDNGVKIIFGDSCSGSTLAAAGPAEENEVILFTSSSSNTQIKNSGDFVFRVFPSDETSGTVLSHYANANFSNIGILTEQTEYAQGLTAGFLKTYSGSAENKSFPSSLTDFTTIVAEIQELNVDAILLMPQTTAKIRLMAEALDAAGWDKDVFGNEILALDELITSDYKEQYEAWNCVSANFIPPSSQSLDDFIAKFEFEYGEELKLYSYAATTVDRNNILKQVLQEVGDETNTEAIRDAIYAIQEYDGLSGILSFDENGEVNLSYSLVVFDGDTDSFVPVE
jgi:branched-chain amino acid transport system substrate-binding protein